MLGIYFSGTGNTEYCVNLLSSLLGETETVSLENPSAAKNWKRMTRLSLVIRYNFPIYRISFGHL